VPTVRILAAVALLCVIGFFAVWRLSSAGVVDGSVATIVGIACLVGAIGSTIWAGVHHTRHWRTGRSDRR
jgi:hypothetical protein